MTPEEILNRAPELERAYAESAEDFRWATFFSAMCVLSLGFTGYVGCELIDSAYLPYAAVIAILTPVIFVSALYARKNWIRWNRSETAVRRLLRPTEVDQTRD